MFPLKSSERLSLGLASKTGGKSACLAVRAPPLCAELSCHLAPVVWTERLAARQSPLFSCQISAASWWQSSESSSRAGSQCCGYALKTGMSVRGQSRASQVRQFASSPVRPTECGLCVARAGPVRRRECARGPNPSSNGARAAALAAAGRATRLPASRQIERGPQAARHSKAWQEKKAELRGTVEVAPHVRRPPSFHCGAPSVALLQRQGRQAGGRGCGPRGSACCGLACGPSLSAARGGLKTGEKWIKLGRISGRDGRTLLTD